MRVRGGCGLVFVVVTVASDLSPPSTAGQEPGGPLLPAGCRAQPACALSVGCTSVSSPLLRAQRPRATGRTHLEVGAEAAQDGLGLLLQQQGTMGTCRSVSSGAAAGCETSVPLSRG